MPKPAKKQRPAPAPPQPSTPPEPPPQPVKRRDIWLWLAPAILILLPIMCFWTPMTSSDTSILWDAADYHRAVQDYMSQELHAGRIPFWTPYPWAGYPFLADPQVGAWYPPNWPFFWIGVSSRVLYVEHCIATIWACFGAFLLALRLVKNRQAAVLAGLCYGLGGFLIANNSHTGVMQTVSWAPWLLLLFDRSLESKPVRNTILVGIAAGLMILAGHFQTSLYTFTTLGLYAVARFLGDRRQWRQIFATAIVIPVMGTLISAIGTVPGLELTANSTRSSLKAIERTEGAMPLEALSTLIDPNHYGGFLSGEYHGPFEMTQYYYYSGILLLPLALLGLRRRSLRWTALLLFVPSVWYAIGIPGGLYLLVARLPGFSSVRAPVNMWLAPAILLPVLAAAGLVELKSLWDRKWLPAAIIVFTCLDLFYVQSVGNQILYSRTSYQSLYGVKEDRFRQIISGRLAPLQRFDAPDIQIALGPLSEFLTSHTEVTFGYSPLRLTRYTDYTDAMKGNPSLRNGLNVQLWFDPKTGLVHENPASLARVNFPHHLVPVSSMEDSKVKLDTLDQEKDALVPAGLPVTAQDGDGTAAVVEFPPGRYKIHYQCKSPSVLRIGAAYYPGWTARVQGHPTELFPVDHALTGVVVPEGEGDLDLEYHSRLFPLGAGISIITLLSCVAGLALQRFRQVKTSLTQ